jgi:membrane-associated PAP2 superfamily phosphatase/SAM-dependent methyltransferase
VVGSQDFELQAVDSSSRGHPPFWIPLVLLFTLSLAARYANLDLRLQGLFWSPEVGWLWHDNGLVRFLYRYGTYPAILATGIVTCAWLCSRIVRKWGKLQSLSLFMVLLLALGPGLMVNAVSKSHFHRPRPRETVAFGGDQHFVPVGDFEGSKEGKSFPSGHASMGFYWLGLFIFYWRRNRILAWTFAGIGLIHGCLLGLVRMAQGGHWFSDVLWAAAFVYLTAWALHWLLRLNRESDFNEPAIAQPFLGAELQAVPQPVVVLGTNQIFASLLPGLEVISPLKRPLLNVRRFYPSSKTRREPKVGVSYRNTAVRFDQSSVASHYATRHCGNARDRREQRCIKRALQGVPRGTRVLDLPSGTGRLLPMLHHLGFKIVEADYSAHMVDHARTFWSAYVRSESTAAAADVVFDVQDIMKTTYAGQSFGATICNRLLHHFSDSPTRVAALKELRRITQGPIIVSFFNANTIDARFKCLMNGLRGTTLQGRIPIPFRTFSSDVEAAGLRVDAIFPTRRWVSPQTYVRLVAASLPTAVVNQEPVESAAF